MSIETLIIEDDPRFAVILKRIASTLGLCPEISVSGEDGLARLKELKPALLLVDLGLPGIDGIEVIKRATLQEPTLVCIVVSGTVNVRHTVLAMRAGAFDVIEKTTDLDEVELRLRRAVDMANIRRRAAFVREREQGLVDIVGASPAIREMGSRIQEVAATPACTVLVVGETGTGKELVARAIHRLSSRRDQPLVSVNAAAIPDNLLESEFFGHEKGSFTGADRSRIGLFEAASGGTLFLDEIGELDLKLQVKLLRALEERRFHRVGGSRDIPIDVRLIAATNRKLERYVAEGHFREDLFYRLNVFRIDVPSLRERRDDVPLLAHHFMARLGQELGKRVTVLDKEAEQLLVSHDFPGNVRELRNLIEQAMILAHGDRLGLEHLRGLGASTGPSAATDRPLLPERKLPDVSSAPLAQLFEALEARRWELAHFEKQLIDRALGEARGNKSQAAELLKMSRYALQRRIKHLEEDLKNQTP